MEPEPPGAGSFCLEPAQVGRSRSRLRDLGPQEPEPPKKVAAPQHWKLSLGLLFGETEYFVYETKLYEAKNTETLLNKNFRRTKISF